MDNYHVHYLCVDDNNEPFRHAEYSFYLDDERRQTGRTDNQGYTDWLKLDKQSELIFHILKD